MKIPSRLRAPALARFLTLVGLITARTSKRHVLRWVAVGFVAVAVAAPVGLGAGPDDRPDYRGTAPALAPGSESPDDRGLYRGNLALVALGPDDRSFSRALDSNAPLLSAPVDVAASLGGFNWGDAMIGSAFGAALALLGTGAILIVHRRRSTLITA